MQSSASLASSAVDDADVAAAIAGEILKKNKNRRFSALVVMLVDCMKIARYNTPGQGTRRDINKITFCIMSSSESILEFVERRLIMKAS